MSSLIQRDLLKNKLPPLTTPPLNTAKRSKHKKKDYSPLPWNDFFDKYEDVKISGKNNIFRVYFRGNSGPAIVLLHGGGHSALSWAVFSVSLTERVDCQVLALDMRSHGYSCTENDDDLSAQCLVNDVIDVITVLFPGDQLTPIILMGHSMGGAIAVRVATENVIPMLSGLAVIDVVEGSAMKSLSAMQSYLRGRPMSFSSLEKAVEWSIKSGQLRNVESARVSMPGQLRKAESGYNVTVNATVSRIKVSAGLSDEVVFPKSTLCAVQESGKEEKEELVGEVKSVKPSSNVVQLCDIVGTNQEQSYHWRIDLSKTEPFWSGWFSGLSQTFLSASVPKILILAGIDNLDKELSIGQMQGKYQLVVLAGCGHSIHEDLPDKVSEIIASFLLRYKLSERKGDLIRPSTAC